MAEVVTAPGSVTPAVPAASGVPPITSVPAAPAATGGDWFAGLSPELQADKSLESFKGKPVGDVVKSFTEAQKLIGGSIRIPKADAPPEERAKFVRDAQVKFGLPETVEGYHASLPEGVKADQGIVPSFLPVAHQAGLLPEQVKTVAEWYTGLERTALQQRAEATAKAETALKQEWGGAYEHKLALIKRAAEQLGGQEFLQEMDLTGKGNSPVVLKVLDAVATMMFEKGMVKGDPIGTLTPDQADKRISEIRADPDFWTDMKNPAKHESLKKEHQMLITLAGKK